MRNIYFLICIILSAGTIGYFSPFFDINLSSSSGGSTLYAVEVTKHKYPVYTDYFEELDDIVEINAKNGEYHYFTGVTHSQSEAEELNTKIKKLGYDEARVVDLKGEFSKDELEEILLKDPRNSEQAKKSVQKKQSVETAISKLTNVGNSYFYTIRLLESDKIMTADKFQPLQPKVYQQEGNYHYLYGKFEDVGNARKYLKDKVAEKYSSAELVVINKGKLQTVSKAKTKTTASSGTYNMGRKMRGKEYVDYYYELSRMNLSKAPVYYIEVGPYDDKELAAEAVQKLQDLGFTKAGIKDPSKEKRSASKPDAAADAHYAIQIFAGKSAVKTSRFNLDEISQSYDQHDELYRYFYGDYDNYWVCRRDLREIRAKGFKDAFIVKL